MWTCGETYKTVPAVRTIFEGQEPCEYHYKHLAVATKTNKSRLRRTVLYVFVFLIDVDTHDISTPMEKRFVIAENSEKATHKLLSLYKTRYSQKHMSIVCTQTLNILDGIIL